MVKALLIVDIQNDFLPPRGLLPVTNGDKLVEPIINLMSDQQWDCFAMTNDKHPANHVSFAKNHNLPDFSTYIYHFPSRDSNETQYGVLWPVHCVENTWGSQVPEELMKKFKSLRKPHKIVYKGLLPDREYYSGFNDIFNDHHTDLDEFLRENYVDEVYIVGVAMDYCVKNSAISAAKLGYRTTILKNFTKAINTDELSMKQFQHEMEKYNIELK